MRMRICVLKSVVWGMGGALLSVNDFNGGFLEMECAVVSDKPADEDE